MAWRPSTSRPTGPRGPPWGPTTTPCSSWITNRSMRVELTDDPSCFIARDWTEVTVADPDGTFFHTPAYLKLWWEEFGSGALRVAVAESDGRPVGAAGVEIVGRELLGAPVFAADRSAGPGPVLRAAPVQPRAEGEVHERGDGDLLPPAGGGLPPGPPVPPGVPGDGWPEGGGSDRVRLQGHLLA